MLTQAGLKKTHPDVLYFERSEKLGIGEARKIKNHFSHKPFQAKGKAVVLEDAGILTPEAQNALLKTLEEPPADALIILAASSDAQFLPTILSRCQIINLEGRKYNNYNNYKNYTKDLEALLKADIPERFEYIEKLKDRGEFLKFLIQAFRQQLLQSTHAKSDLARLEIQNFLKELLQAEQWAKQNVNIRAILEYLMLVMPQKL